MGTGSVTLRIGSRFDDVVLIGLSVRALCAAVPLDEQDARAVELCVVEAVNNAVEHAYRGEAGHWIDVVFQPVPGELRIDVCDRGERMDWTRVCRGAEACADDPYAEGGRGLFIMRSLMDEVGYGRRGGDNVLTLVKRVAPPLRTLLGAGRRSGAA